MKPRYFIVVIIVAIFVTDWIIQAPDSRSRELTEAIQALGSERLKSYPYTFWVTEIKGTTAHLSTPRDRTVPARHMIAAIHPEINTKDANDPAFVAAEKELAAIQDEARALVLKQHGITDVRWTLDRKWLSAHHIDLPPQ